MLHLLSLLPLILVYLLFSFLVAEKAAVVKCGCWAILSYKTYWVRGLRRLFRFFKYFSYIFWLYKTLYCCCVVVQNPVQVKLWEEKKKRKRTNMYSRCCVPKCSNEPVLLYYEYGGENFLFLVFIALVSEFSNLKLSSKILIRYAVACY